MDRLAKQQACQLFIEQEIEKGLAEKKTTYQIGKDVAKWIEKLFQAKVNPDTIRVRADRLCTNVHTNPNNGNHSRIEEIQDFKHGGAREGAGRPPKFAVVCDQSHFRTSFTGDNEAYTPVKYIDLARKVLGKIDLDPASDSYAQKRIQAKKYFSIEEDGLVRSWFGKVWMNPPYSQPLIMRFIEKAISEWKAGNFTEGIFLTNNYTDTAWFHLAESCACLLCFTKGRIKFEKNDGSISQAMNGQTFFYYGNNGSKFKEVFSSEGFIR